MNLFITATDTDIGKTFITAGLAAIMQSLGYRAGVFKPIQSGAVQKNSFLIAPDLAFVKKVDPYISTLSSYVLKPPVAPALAAEIDKVKIEMGKIIKDYQIICSKCDSVLVEGAGGIMTPCAPDMFISDIIKALNLPVLIIAGAQLGTINHVLLTLNHAKSLGLKVRGVIINKYPDKTDDLAVKTVVRMIEEYSDTKVVGIVKDLKNAKLTPGLIIDTILNSVDLEKIFNTKIPKLDLGL